MIRELQVIFGLHTVPGELRVASHVLVLFKQLRGIAAAALLAATALLFVLALIPFGPLLIWGPAAAWLYIDGEIGWAIFVVVWSLAAGFVTDNVLRPYLISRGSDLPLILILFGVIGGAVAFGFLGLFRGPTLRAVGYELIREWNAAEQTDA